MSAAATGAGTGTGTGRYVALCGGIGGAKLALGLSKVLPPDRLTIVVNTGDDFEHMGLHVSPDVDTVLYTLAGLSNQDLGWGLAGETWSFMGAMARLGGPDWFRLGDHDLATHVLRTDALRRGETLSEVTEHLRQRLGVAPNIVPMSDDPVRTVVDTDEGRLDFQRYFVGRRCEPRLTAIHFEGATSAKPAPAAVAALQAPDLAGIIICPSNPWLSVDPMLAVPGLRRGLANRTAPCVAVTPLVGGMAIKGPTAKIMAELGHPLDVTSIVAHYRGLIDGFILDQADAAQAPSLGLPVHVTNTIMRTLDDRVKLGQAAIGHCRSLETGTGRPPQT